MIPFTTSAYPRTVNPTTRRGALRALTADDTGSTLLLTIFYGALSLALILVVVAATSLYIERKRLFTLADGAALDGAESFSLTDVHKTKDGYRATLHPSEVRSAVEAYVHDNPHDAFTELRIEDAGTGDGRSAEVRLSAHWRPPLISLLVPDGIRLEVTATARSVFS